MQRFLIFASALLLSAIAFANGVPAKRGFITIEQPNGKTLTYMVKGDEVMSWCESADGYTLLRNEANVLCYAFLNYCGDLIASEIIACNPEQREVEELVFLSKIEKGLFWSEKQLEQFAKRRQQLHQVPEQTAH